MYSCGIGLFLTGGSHDEFLDMARMLLGRIEGGRDRRNRG
jgi:hypothetical protein